MENTPKKIVTRFAPSPTGTLHIGNYRTAIFAYLWARHCDGEFILRIEDTDRERNKKEYEENIIDGLEWLGLTYDRFYRQSENLPRHTEVLKQLIASGHAYISEEAAKDGSGVMKSLVRFKNPNKEITVHDLIKGDVVIDTTDLGDFVIARAIDDPIFHFAVVIDDWDEGVTHVIRGEEHLPNTPRQILMMEALGAPIPTYAHLPLVLGPDKLKLSKRRGAPAITVYRELGYLPEAILNTAVMIGWNPGTEQEIFTKEEMIAIFDLEKVQKSGGVFNQEKMDWINREHLKKISDESFAENIHQYTQALTALPQYNEEKIKKLIPLIRERTAYFSEVKIAIENGEYDCFFDAPSKMNPEKIYFKGVIDPDLGSKLEGIKASLEAIADTDWTLDIVKTTIMNHIGDTQKGPYLHPLRMTLSGRDQSPDPFTIAWIIGKTETMNRIQNIITLL